MRSLNRVMLMGHLAADVEMRQTQSGQILATFSMATNRFSRNADGSKKEVADFHRIVAWAKLGEICGRYLTTGMPILVEGRIVNRVYDDKEKVRHYRTEIVAEEVNILNWAKAKNGKEQVGFKEIPAAEKVLLPVEPVEKEELVAA